jgi:replication factor C subunit 1
MLDMVYLKRVIMDEIDGMAGNADMGVASELLSIAKVSKNPIICICNDRNSPKIISLANSCYDLRVKRPLKTQIASRIVSIAHSEGLQFDSTAAEQLTEKTGHDIRQVLRAFQIWQASSSSSSSFIPYQDMKQNMHQIERDKMLPYDVCLFILRGKPNDR